MKYLWILTLSAFFLSCTPSVSPYFEQNRYIRNYNIHVVNDSLELYFNTPADIVYATDVKELKKEIRKKKFDLKGEVLVYGTTQNPPYEYFLIIPEHKIQAYPAPLVILDTIINDQAFRFVGNPISIATKRNLEADMQQMMKSLEVGPDYKKEIITVIDIVKKYQHSNKFYAALNEIIEFPTYNKQEDWTKLQMALTFSSFLGDNSYYKEYLHAYEAKFTLDEDLTETIANNLQTGNAALETILAEANRHQFLLINENHFYPNHRLLVLDLLEPLKALGYRYLALEALQEGHDTLLNEKGGYPTLQTGFYTNEQLYADLIRKAKSLGFTFVAYENTDETQDREKGQAHNLIQKTIESDPKAKVLVLAGIDHILENPTANGKSWMASILKKEYKIDPLTISQTHLNAYRHQTDAYYGLISGHIFEKDRLKAVDFHLLNNKVPQQAQTSFKFKNEFDQTVQVLLFKATEIENPYDYLNKVPYYTTLLESKKNYTLPGLEREEVFMVILDKNGKCLEKRTVNK